MEQIGLLLKSMMSVFTKYHMLASIWWRQEFKKEMRAITTIQRSLKPQETKWHHSHGPKHKKKIIIHLYLPTTMIFISNNYVWRQFYVWRFLVSIQAIIWWVTFAGFAINVDYSQNCCHRKKFVKINK